MRLNRFIGLVAVAIAAIAIARFMVPSHSPTSVTVATGLPDLTVSGMSYGAATPGCTVPGDLIGLHATIQNVGDTPATAFIVETDGKQQAVPGLTAGDTVDLFFAPLAFLDPNVRVDVTSVVVESDESNNVFAWPPVVLPPACTPTPGPSPTPAPTATPDPCFNGPDCDGFWDIQPLRHYGPLNVTVQVDNCPGTYNPGQENADGDYLKLQPFRPFDDKTEPMSDGIGDACDADDDNDGILDGDELTGAACGGIVTNQGESDSDFDGVLDLAECVLGTNPTLAASFPSPMACAFIFGGASFTTDDTIPDYREFCYYGTPRLSSDDDGDGCSDAREIASINQNRSVDVIDLGQVALAAGTYAPPGNVAQRNSDMTRNGRIDVIDLSFVASSAGTCPNVGP